MNLRILLLQAFVLFCLPFVNGQVKLVDPKGTKIAVDSSKWKWSGTNIVAKNSGNTGIGTSSPLFKLDVAAVADPLRLLGLQNGAVITDSIVAVQNGVIRKLAPIGTLIPNRNDSTTASNGLTLAGKDVRLGGNLTQATTIATGGNVLTIATGGSALNITGLQNGTVATDSIMVVNNGAVRKLAPIGTLIPNRNDSTTASNGLTLAGKDVRLGGNLTQATTIGTNGNGLNITGLPGGTATDSIMTINNTTGQLRKIQLAELQPKIIELFDAAGTQALTTTFTNLNLATANIADNGYSAAAGVVTVNNTGTYRITLRATVRVTNNNSSGGEFRLTLGGNAIPGTLGYTYQHNANRLYGTVTIVKVMTLPANSSIAAQGRRYSNAGNLTLAPDGSSLLIEKIK